MIAALRFVELVAAIVALIARMRDINTELVAQLAHLRRARPRSETLERLERQLVLPLDGLIVTARRQAQGRRACGRRQEEASQGDIPGAARRPRTCRACPCSIACRPSCASARSAARR